MERIFLKGGVSQFSAGFSVRVIFGTNWGVIFCLWDELGSDVLSGANWGVTFCQGRIGK
uniref:Uncharacterized protein n=1 Tax=Meloidogyne enterolobii TaxID=390850 RepID=A0A6V7XXL9_MELEN|nr:unnamed protein product [Meloidogyne enterolobii]